MQVYPVHWAYPTDFGNVSRDAVNIDMEETLW